MPDYHEVSKRYRRPPPDVTAKIAELKDMLIPHAHFDKAMAEIVDAIGSKNPDTFIIILGESKVGKTTLRKTLCGVLDAWALEEGRERGHMAFSVPSVDKMGRMDWVEISDRAANGREPLPDKKRAYPPIEQGALVKVSTPSRSVQEMGRMHSMMVNMREEQIPLIMDEANAIPSNLSRLQHVRAVHMFKDMMEQSGQPVIAFGTLEIKLIVELSINLRLRCRIVQFRAYSISAKKKDTNQGEKEVKEPRDLRDFRSFLGAIEKKLGSKFCDEKCLTSHAEDILRRLDGRPGKVFSITNDILSDSSGARRVTWVAFDALLAERFPESLRLAMAMERRETEREIRAALSIVNSIDYDQPRQEDGRKKSNPNAFKRRHTNTTRST